jgi:hypothetical protein
LAGILQVDLTREVTLDVLAAEVSVDSQREDGIRVDLTEDGAITVVLVRGTKSHRVVTAVTAALTEQADGSVVVYVVVASKRVVL